MSELYPHASLELSAYQNFVAESRFKNTGDTDWKDAYSALIRDEQLEFIDQHGPGALLLLPRGFSSGFEPEDAPAELRFHMADEMGDMLWFTTDVADRLGLTAENVCAASLEKYSGAAPRTLTSFHDLELAATEHAGAIRLPNKIGMQFPQLDPELHHTGLADHPFYVYMRAVHRLSRSLDEGQHDMAPPTATELEPIQSPAESVGTLLLALAYIATDRLGISIDDIARFNMAKLAHRKEFGKTNDLVFDEAFLRSPSA